MPLQPNTSMRQRLLGYGIAASAVTLTAGPASADIVYWNPADITTPPGANAGTWFSLTTGQVQNSYLVGAPFKFDWATFSGVPGQSGIRISTSQARFIVAPTVGGNYSSAARLAGGQFVGPGGNFNDPLNFNQVGTIASSYHYFGEWNTPDNGFVGLKFNSNGNTYYGWAQIHVNANASITLEDFAYNNTPDTGLVTGVVPEPRTMSALLLAAGAAGTAIYRRRRAHTAAAGDAIP
ncbi:MAG: PEP-CTERM sorting domain-containing protein, partial [Rhodospirillales bacterium]|nr:PEP-CTERM sorting domain-containing protein [Acetobacter sp.]